MTIMAESMTAKQEGRHRVGVVAESLCLIHKQWAERKTEPSLIKAFETSKPSFNDTSSSTRPYLLVLSQTDPLAGKQTFKYVSLWSPFSFK